MRGSSSPVVAVASVIFVVVVSAVLPAAAQAQPAIVMDRAFTFVQENPCVAGETVTGTGRQTIAAYTRFDESGGAHITLRTITKGQAAVAVSPFEPVKHYVFSDENIAEQNTSSLGTSFEFTIVVNHVLIRKAEGEGDIDPLLGMGTGEDFMMKETIHFTVKDGVPTATVVQGHSRCM